jgi:hypothetical protein
MEAQSVSHLTIDIFCAKIKAKLDKRRKLMNEQERNEFAESAKMALAQSWEAHRQAFGPILEPAFKDRPPLRIPLTAALNHISRKEIKKGIEILESLKEHCTCDEDHAAWTFCV